MQADYDVLLPHNIECVGSMTHPIPAPNSQWCQKYFAVLLHDSALTAASLQCHRVLWKVFVAVHAW